MSEQVKSEFSDLLSHLDAIGWRPDAKGDAECVDEGAARAADAIRQLERALSAERAKVEDMEAKFELLGASERLYRDKLRNERAKVEELEAKLFLAEKIVDAKKKLAHDLADDYMREKTRADEVTRQRDETLESIRDIAVGEKPCGHVMSDAARLSAIRMYIDDFRQRDDSIQSTAPVPVSVPTGWKLVPVEPTTQMLEAIMSWQTSGNINAYKAMIAAAPQPTTKEGT